MLAKRESIEGIQMGDCSSWRILSKLIFVQHKLLAKEHKIEFLK